MDEFRSVNEKLAIDLMGLPYVKIPRYTLNLLKCPATRQLGQLHILLFDICFFADGYAKLNGGSLIKVHGYTSLIAPPETKDASQKENEKQSIGNIFTEAERLYGNRTDRIN